MIDLDYIDELEKRVRVLEDNLERMEVIEQVFFGSASKYIPPKYRGRAVVNRKEALEILGRSRKVNAQRVFDILQPVDLNNVGVHEKNGYLVADIISAVLKLQKIDNERAQRA